MNTLKRFLAVMITLTLMVTGCGGGSGKKAAPRDVQPAGSTPSTSPAPIAANQPSQDQPAAADAPLAFGNLVSPEGLKDILNLFALLSYEFVSPEDSTRVTIRSTGQETVGGSPADHVIVEIKGSDGDAEQLELWVNAGGETVKVLADGTEMSGEMAGMAGNAMLMGIFWPFTLTAQMGMDAALQAGSSSPFQIARSSRQKKQFGSVSADTHTLTVKVPGVAESVGYTWEVADFGKFQMLTRWEVVLTGSGSNAKAEYRVAELDLR